MEDPAPDKLFMAKQYRSRNVRLLFGLGTCFWKDPSLIGVGKSFPSGHVSIVAVFIIFYYIFKHPVYWAEKVKKWDYKAKLRLFTFFKWAGLFISIILGILTGVARIVVGAHHASDVLWAFGMIYIINAIFYYWIFNIPKYELKKMYLDQ